ncbi:MAG: hypothetical protein LQ346_000143 [Caloplaca aetnensis]|nr:MAG: hypothetical protein LQ346_000143 [Caloplaca aetnensis]
MTRRQSHPQLWARAPAFVPRARSQQGAVAALEERRSPASDTYSTSTSPPGRLIYDNQVAGIPSHWVPVYGSGHGIFYEPVTKLFYNDGFPRPAMERRDGKVRPVDNSSLPHPIGLRRQDILHIHSPSLTEPINQAVENSPSAVERYYCRCVDAWLVNSHDCPDEDDAKEDSTRQVPALKVTPGAISPDDEIQPESSTRGLAGGDLCHRSWQQRHTYGYSERMPMLLPGVAETVVVPSWVDGGRQGWIRARRT